MSDVEQEIKTEEVDDPNGKGKNGEYKEQPRKRKSPKPIERHIATALDGTTLYCCPTCHLAYPEKQLLKQHLEVHETERPFICDICNLGFKRSDHLARHRRLHDADKSFVCSICQKGFKRKENLKLHQAIHSDKKTEICNKCGKGFIRKDHLRKHARTHLVESDSETSASNGNNDQE